MAKKSIKTKRSAFKSNKSSKSNLSSSSSSSSRLLGAIQGSSTLHNSKVNYGKRKTKKDSGTTSGSESMIVVGDERKKGSKKKNLIFDHKLLQLKQRHHLSSRAVTTAVKLDKEQLKSRRKQGFTLAPPIFVAPSLLQCSDPNKYPVQTIDSDKTSIDGDPPGPQHEEVKQLFELADGLLHGEEDRAPPGLKPKSCSSKTYISFVSRNRFEGLQSDDLSDSDDDDRHLHSYNSFPVISIKPALFQLPAASRVSVDPLDDL